MHLHKTNLSQHSVPLAATIRLYIVPGPGGLVHRIGALSQDRDRSRHFAILVSRYIQANAHPYTIACIRNACRSFGEPQQPSQRHRDIDRFACVLQYHPVFRTSMRYALNRHPVPEHLPFRFMLSWANGVPSLGDIVSWHNAVLSKGNSRRVGMTLLSTSSSTCNSSNLNSIRDLTFKFMNELQSSMNRIVVGPSEP